jgi:hypothetical protein
MMDGQTTTFWESFAEGNLGGKKYPTRSYCHAWSAGPAYTFSRYVMGVRIDEPGGKKVTIVPRVDCLKNATGVVPLAQGEIGISWKNKEDEKAELHINIKGPITAELKAPPGLVLDKKGAVILKPNTSHKIRILKQK